MRRSGGRAYREIAQRSYTDILAECGPSIVVDESLPDLPDTGPALEKLPFEAAFAIAIHDDSHGPMTLQLPGDKVPFAIPKSWHARARELVMPMLDPKLQAALVSLQTGWRCAARERDDLAAVAARVDRGEIRTLAELEIACRAVMAPERNEAVA